MRMKLYLLIGFIGLSVFVYGQDGPKVVVFNSTESKAPEYLSKYNLIKFNVFEAFSGDFSLYYERILNKNFSAEVGLGVTLYDYFSSLINSNFEIDNDVYEPLLGVSFSLGGRYYPFRAADEFYVGPEFKYKYYHNNYNYTDYLGQNASLEEFRTIVLPRLTFGYVYFFDDNIFIDYSAGFGIGKITTGSVESVYDISTGATNYILDEQSRLVPRFHMGLKVGLAF